MLALTALAVFATAVVTIGYPGRFLQVWQYAEPAWLKYPLLLLLAFVVYRMVVARSRTPAFQKEIAAWRKTWICKRCSTKFIHEGKG